MENQARLFEEPKTVPTVLPGGKQSQPEIPAGPARTRTFFVAAVGRYNSEAQLKAIEDGGKYVTFERERGNNYDANAVRVLLDGRFCGYVPQRPDAGLSSREAATLLDAGWTGKGLIDKVEPGFPLYRWQIRVQAKFMPPGGDR